MRVITGSARGRKLQTLEGRDVRPTTDKVKESVFSIIQFQIQGRVFVDLFAGSGQMGIEALSRGAEKAYLVDQSLKAIRVIEQNVKTCGFEDNAHICRQDAAGFLMSARENFDVVYVDPPFEKGIIDEVLPMLSSKMNKGGVILCESADNEVLPEEAGDFVLDRTYRYGKIKVSLYRHKEMV
ncbi:MAG: 16S rRNA (guanine(966)-N(2))-methyltransferase RsmD [Ruminococcaceae bacterium]|nr:16S rRNA (guanine(966)-N(2))-methyltransferase RsmD [Oscillospiraceae bacterium]